MEGETSGRWTVDDAKEMYGISRWGLGYFGINEHGQVTVSPLKKRGPALPLLTF